jgi:hypothetical protein
MSSAEAADNVWSLESGVVIMWNLGRIESFIGWVAEWGACPVRAKRCARDSYWHQFRTVGEPSAGPTATSRRWEQPGSRIKTFMILFAAGKLRPGRDLRRLFASHSIKRVF